ncbi:nodulation protein NodH [Rhodobacteraceae bacterium]|nr:nodulation protein NodH [Paracoccaceae bacterium]
MAKFDSFVILAEMRTGSNLLEAAVNMLQDVHCHGEAFNPVMIGYPNRHEILGISKEERDADPKSLWKAIRKAPGLNGCRYFHEHDPRVRDMILRDQKCAKIILTRNPVESYVSLEIARATGQWKLGDAKGRKTARAAFDAEKFENHLQTLQNFQILIMNALQVTGQSAFYIDYEDAQNVEVLNGLANWLGLEDGPDSMPANMVPQNPEPLEAKVENYPEMEASLARLDRFNLSRTPNFEPRRGPNVPGFIACETEHSGLLYMPMRPALSDQIQVWMAQIGPLVESFSQKTLRQWKRQHNGHRSFTVLRHPLMRAHLAFDAVLERQSFSETREVLRTTYKLNLPKPGQRLPAADYPDVLEAFIRWLKSNLNTQTSLPVSPLWASQSALLQGFSSFAAPDLLAREEQLADDLAYIAQAAGIKAPRLAVDGGDSARIKLADIWSPALEKAARESFTRDYMQFGFGDWQRGQ